MAVRDGMLALIQQLRLMTETSSNTDDTDNYFSSDDLQTMLDRHSSYHVRVPLTPIREVLPGNTAIYTRYTWGSHLTQWLEYPLPEFDLTTFKIQDSTGAYVFLGSEANEYQVDLARRMVIFGSNREGKLLYLSAYSYDLNAAAAEVWLQKAGKRQDYINWKTDNHTLSQDQEYQHCMEQYRLYSSRAATKKVGKWRRTDTMNGGY